jgi:hypothetical protein
VVLLADLQHERTKSIADEISCREENSWFALLSLTINRNGS